MYEVLLEKKFRSNYLFFISTQKVLFKIHFFVYLFLYKLLTVLVRLKFFVVSKLCLFFMSEVNEAEKL